MARRALDSFTVTIDGGPVGVTKGDILPEGDRVLRHLDKVAPGSHLFKNLVEDEPSAVPPPGDKPPKTAPGVAAKSAGGKGA